MKNTKIFSMGAVVGIMLGFIYNMFSWMFHYDAVPHFLFPVITTLYLPLWIASLTTDRLIESGINLLIEINHTSTKYGDWPYSWDGLYKWLGIIQTIVWMAISYGLLFLLVAKVMRHFKKQNASRL